MKSRAIPIMRLLSQWPVLRRFLYVAGGLLILLAVMWMGAWRTGQNSGNSNQFFQVQYDTEAEGNLHPELMEEKKQQRKGCQRNRDRQYCGLAGGADDPDQLHLAKPSGPQSLTISAHGVSVLSATLSLIKGQRVAAILLTDPRDWMSKAQNVTLQELAKRHIEGLNGGKSLVSCSFRGRNTATVVHSHGHIVTHAENRLLVVHCPLPEQVACCVRDKISSLSGRRPSLPVCVTVQVSFTQPKSKEQQNLQTLKLGVYKVCQFGQVYNKVGLTVLVDKESLPYFPQWISYHRWLGVRLVFVYLQDVNHKVAQEKLQRYISDGSVIVSAWDVTLPQEEPSNKDKLSPWKWSAHESDRRSRLELAIFTDCLYRYRHSSDMMLIVDPHQYILWRNTTCSEKDMTCPAAIQPASISDMLPEKSTWSTSSTILALRQAVFHPPVGSTQKKGSNTGESNAQHSIPMDISSVMRCSVETGISVPRYGYDFQKLRMAWSGGGETLQGASVKVSQGFGRARLNSYHNAKLDCAPNIFDTAMHQATSWTLMDFMVESVSKIYTRGQL